MKKLIGVLAVMFSIDAAAYTGTGNDRIGEAREYMRQKADGANINYLKVGWWIGTVSACHPTPVTFQYISLQRKP